MNYRADGAGWRFESSSRIFILRTHTETGHGNKPGRPPHCLLHVEPKFPNNTKQPQDAKLINIKLCIIDVINAGDG